MKKKEAADAAAASPPAAACRSNNKQPRRGTTHAAVEEDASAADDDDDGEDAAATAAAMAHLKKKGLLQITIGNQEQLWDGDNVNRLLGFGGCTITAPVRDADLAVQDQGVTPDDAEEWTVQGARGSARWEKPDVPAEEEAEAKPAWVKSIPQKKSLRRVPKHTKSTTKECGRKNSPTSSHSDGSRTRGTPGGSRTGSPVTSRVVEATVRKQNERVKGCSSGVPVKSADVTEAETGVTGAPSASTVPIASGSTSRILFPTTTEEPTVPTPTVPTLPTAKHSAISELK